MKKFLPTKQLTIDNGQRTKKKLSNVKPARNATQPARIDRRSVSGESVAGGCQMSNAFGFTLVELLVVVSIIAILSVIGIVVFSTAQQNARDGKRRADLDAIAKALEVNYGKVAPGTYNIDSAYFNSNKLPQDTSFTRFGYCISYYNGNDRSVDKTSVVPGVWTRTSTTSYVDTDCPAATSETGHFMTGTTILPTGVLWWRVCAVLENPASTVVCKFSAQ